jgi:hypothetical protein
MITVKHPSDLLQPTIPSPHLNLIQLRFRQLRQIYGDAHDPEKDGYLVYVEAGEDDLPLSELGLDHVLSDLPFEGSHFHPVARCHEAVLVTNNSFALTFIIPDEFISEETRRVLMSLG